MRTAPHVLSAPPETCLCFALAHTFYPELLCWPIQLERAGISLQANTGWLNIKGAVRRYLGYCASVRGEEAVAAAGLLDVLDGPLIAGFVAWLLQSRETTLSTAVQTKVCAYAVAAFYPEVPEGANQPRNG